MIRKNILYVDDIRNIPLFYNRTDKIIIARNYKEAIKNLTLIKKFDIIDLDHDLGEEKSGYDIAKYIVENQIKVDTIRIHSMNPVGVQNIRQLLQRYGYRVEI